MTTPKNNTPIWIWPVVILGGAALGLLARPLVQNLLGGGGSQAPTVRSSVRCPGPADSDLAVSETVRQSTSVGVGLQNGNSATFERAYQLERPGQPPLQFAGGGDNQSEALRCEDVRFGPGPRITLGRGPEAFVIELVGPTVARFQSGQNSDLAKLVVEPRWKLALNLGDYQAQAPQIAEDGKRGSLTLRRAQPSAGLPEQLVLTTTNGGTVFVLDRAQSQL